MRDLLAKCGNNCGRCLLYVENLTVERCRQVAKGMATYHNWKPDPQNRCGPVAGARRKRASTI